MAKGYMGISLDAFGNFSSALDGTKNGGPGKRAGAIAVRGPGDGKGLTDYVYQTGVTASDAPYNAGFLGFTQRFPSPSSINYRKIKIILKPGSSLGASIGYKITVVMTKGGTTQTNVTLINEFDYPFAAPAQLKFGLAASTGAITNYHEIRNLSIDVTNTTSLLSPVLTPDLGTICQGEPVFLDVLSNDISNNSNGIMNRSSIDLNTSVAGIQTTYQDPGKGLYEVLSNGLVSFTPSNGFVGLSTINYSAGDSYGVTATSPSTITVSVGLQAAPDLTISNPVAVCFPQTVNITDPVYKIETTPGATYSYFQNLTDANSNVSNINAAAGSINQSGTYFIRASLSGCATIKPIVVTVSKTPTVSAAGPDQNFCSSTGGQSLTLLSNNPDVGVGTWAKVSGPSGGTINYPNASTTPLMNLPTGVHVYRWTITNGVCAASTDDIQVNVGIPSAAGAAQIFANQTTATLQGNDPSPATGVWTQTAGPSANINSINNPSSVVTGLVPGNSYTFQWRIVNGPCNSSSSVTVNDVLNTIANAGPDRVLANVNQVALEGNAAGAGNTGLWTIISSPPGSLATIESPSSSTSNLTGINAVGVYTLQWTMTNGTFSNSDQVNFIITTILPVRLISFTAHEVNRRVTLEWQTENESDNQRFEIERSVDGNSFIKIGEVDGSGTTSTQRSYSYPDDLSSQLFGKVYYRLKQIDYSGAFTYSRIVAIDLSETEQMTAYPNPFAKTLNIRIYSARAGNAILNFYNAGGQLLLRKTVKLAAGQNSFDFSDLEKIARGVITVKMEKNGKVYSMSVVKSE
jgi:hypothetical protein